MTEFLKLDTPENLDQFTEFFVESSEKTIIIDWLKHQNQIDIFQNLAKDRKNKLLEECSLIHNEINKLQSYSKDRQRKIKDINCVLSFVNRINNDQIEDNFSHEKHYSEQLLNELIFKKEKEIRETEIREKEIREKEIREKEIREKEIREKEIREKEIREKEIREKEIREKEIKRKDDENMAKIEDLEMNIKEDKDQSVVEAIDTNNNSQICNQNNKDTGFSNIIKEKINKLECEKIKTLENCVKINFYEKQKTLEKENKREKEKLHNFTKLKTIKTLQSGGNNFESLKLMEDGIIRKKYAINDPEQVKRFQRELLILRHLDKCVFVPSVLHFIPDKCILFMTFCGEISPEDNPDNRRKYAILTRKLKQNWGVFIIKDNKIINQVPLEYCSETSDGIGYLLDFGSLDWQIDQSRQYPMVNE